MKSFLLALALLIFAGALSAQPFDIYGGNTVLSCPNATGHFIVEKVGNRWWFCTPLGHVYIAMSTTATPQNQLADCAGTNVATLYKAKYGDNTYNYAWQSEKRLTAEGFNAMGQDTGKYFLATTTCTGSTCIWPGVDPRPNPIQLPYFSEQKPAESAMINTNGLIVEPIKDHMKGLNANYNSWRGAAVADVFDTKLHTWWTSFLASAGPVNIRNNSPWLLGVYTDDSDFLWGSGVSPDFFPPAGINTAASIAWMVMIAAPNQTFVKSTAFQSKAFLFSDTAMHSKTDANNTVGCSITTPCSLRDFLHDRYANIAALNTAWGSNYTQFDSTGIAVTGESIGTGDGTTTVFTHTLAHNPISPQSVAVLVGGVLTAGDCPGYIGGCVVTSSTKGTIWSVPLSKTLVTATITVNVVDYSAGTITLTFAAAPASGTAITMNYVYNGWMSGGTGVMDENGSNKTWVGSNPWCMTGADANYPTYFSCDGSHNPVPNAQATYGADMNLWTSEYAAKYFKVMHDDFKAVSALPYLGLDIMGSAGAPAPRPFIQGAAPYVDGMFTSMRTNIPLPSPAAFHQSLNYMTRYAGDLPLTIFIVPSSQSDSSFWCKGHPGASDLATQPALGQMWYDTANYLLNTQGFNSTFNVIGMNYWTYQDFANLNEGLTTVHDNLYDGVQDCVAVGTDSNGFKTGGEVVPGPWAANTTYATGTTIWQNVGGEIFQITADTGGISGGSVPTFPAVGNTVTDGTAPNQITWNVRGDHGPPSTSTCFGNSYTTIQRANQLWNVVANASATLTVVSSLPSGIVNQTYSQALEAVGGTAPYTWTISVGSLPAGLSLNSATGVISGTPSVSGTSNFTAKVTDNVAATATQSLQIVINPATTLLVVTTGSLPIGLIGASYSATLTATGGTPPYTAWALINGTTLPGGLSLNTSTGVISGIPTIPGVAKPFTVQVTDSASATAIKTLTVTTALATTPSSSPRVAAWQYLQPDNPGDVEYVPTWSVEAPLGQEILYLRLVGGFYELRYCEGSPGDTATSICAPGTSVCISCSTTFRTAVWGSPTTVKSVGQASWFQDINSNFYMVFSAQNSASTLAGFGVPANGVSTADPGIGSDHDIWIMDSTFTKFFKVTSQTCSTLCGGTAPGLAANGTRSVPITGKFGAWFPAGSEDGSRIGWSYTSCVTVIDGASNCTGVSIGSYIEWVIWSAGNNFPSTAKVAFVAPPVRVAGGIDCTTTCSPTIPQYFHEMHAWHPTDSTKFLMHTSNLIQTGAVAIVSVAPPGSVTYLNQTCMTPFTDTNICHWTEHTTWTQDAQYVVTASTIDTGSVAGARTASPVWFSLTPSFATYPPFQELELFDPHEPNSIGRVKLTGFNNPTAPEFVDPACHNRYAAVATSPDGQYILANIEQINAAGNNIGTCTAGKGFTFVLLTMNQPMETFGGTILSGGVQLTKQ